MKLLAEIWMTLELWPAKRAFFTRITNDATAGGDLALALDASWYIAMGDKFDEELKQSNKRKELCTKA